MAKVKQKGGYKGSGDSISKRLGVKMYDGQNANPGSILIRQRGTKFYPGKNVRRAKDDTLYAVKSGKVKFTKKRKTSYDGTKKKISIVSVV